MIKRLVKAFPISTKSLGRAPDIMDFLAHSISANPARQHRQRLLFKQGKNTLKGFGLSVGTGADHGIKWRYRLWF